MSSLPSSCDDNLTCAPLQDLTQRMMLATWLVEIYLSKISQLEDIAAAERASEDVENYTMEKGLIEDDMCQFLTTYKVSCCLHFGSPLLLLMLPQDNLDPKTVFNLLASHGRDEMTLYYAGVVGDHERIITHWILEEDWLKALEALNKQVRRSACLSPLKSLIRLRRRTSTSTTASPPSSSADHLSKPSKPLCVNQTSTSGD